MINIILINTKTQKSIKLKLRIKLNKIIQIKINNNYKNNIYNIKK